MDRTRQWGSVRNPQAEWLARADPMDTVWAIKLVDSWLVEHRGIAGQVHWGINAWDKYEHLLRIRYIERQPMGPLKEGYSLTVQVRAMRAMENERALRGRAGDEWSDDEYGRYDEILRSVAAAGEAVAHDVAQGAADPDADASVADGGERDTTTRR